MSDPGCVEPQQAPLGSVPKRFKEELMAKKKQPRRPGRCYTLEVSIIAGGMKKAFVKKTPICSRTIEVLSSQTLPDLHEAIFDAFDRWDEHDAGHTLAGRDIPAGHKHWTI